MERLKTFEDLEFVPHETAIALKRTFPARCDKDPYMQSMCEATHARMEFPNGYGISVICGIQFWSDGKDTYEVCGTYMGDARLGRITGWQTREQVTEFMKELQTKE